MGDKGKAIFGAFAAALGDETVDWLTQGNFEHLPEFANDDKSVGLIASERQIDAGPTESVEDLAARLVDAIPTWKRAGSPLGLLLALHYAELMPNSGDVVIVQQNGRGCSLTLPVADNPFNSLVITELGGNPTLSDHPWWTFDMDDDFCSRFAVLFPNGSPLPGGDPLSDPEDLARARRAIAKWRPEKATCMGLFVTTAGTTIGWPVRIIGNGSNIGAVVVSYTS